MTDTADTARAEPTVLQAEEGVVTGGRVKAPVTWKTYMMCAFAAFGGIFFGYDSGYISGVMAMDYFIHEFTGKVRLETSFLFLLLTSLTLLTGQSRLHRPRQGNGACPLFFKQVPYHLYPVRWYLLWRYYFWCCCW
jgi:hypothetical protein